MFAMKLNSDIVVHVCFQGYAAHRDDRNKRCYINKISSNFQDDAPSWAKTTTVRVSTIILLRMLHLSVSEDVRSGQKRRTEKSGILEAKAYLVEKYIRDFFRTLPTNDH